MRLHQGCQTRHCALSGPVTLLAGWWCSQHLLSKRALREKPKGVAHPPGIFTVLVVTCRSCSGVLSPKVGTELLGLVQGSVVQGSQRG